MSLSVGSGRYVLETNGALTVELRDRTEGDLRCPACMAAALAPGTARVAPVAVSG